MFYWFVYSTRKSSSTDTYVEIIPQYISTHNLGSRCHFFYFESLHRTVFYLSKGNDQTLSKRIVWKHHIGVKQVDRYPARQSVHCKTTTKSYQYVTFPIQFGHLACIHAI